MVWVVGLPLQRGLTPVSDRRFNPFENGLGFLRN